MITYITVDSTITGVGKYAYDMYNLLKPDSEIVQVLFDKKYSDVNYKKPVNGSSYTIVNYLFSGFLYKNTINMINSRENIIHITSQTMKPVLKASTTGYPNPSMSVGKYNTSQALYISVSSNQPRKNLSMVKRVMENLGNEYKLVRIGPELGV